MNAQSYWSRSPGRVGRRGVLRGGAIGLAGLAGAALVGCREGGKTPAAVATPALGAATPVASGGSAKRGGILRMAGQLTGDVPSLDADRTNGSAMGSIAFITGVKLTQWDERPDSPGPVENVLPDFAETWESRDGLTWIFKLRKGVKTSDGLQLKADDVVWSFERNAAMKGAGFGNLENNIRDMFPNRKPAATAIDDYTLQVKLLSPDADFISLMGSHFWTVEHKEVITKKGTDLGKTAPGYGDITSIDQIRGGGPYYPSEYVPVSGFKLKRNPNYYDPTIAYLDGIDHPLIVDTSAAAASLEAGQIDAFGPLTQFSVQQGIDLQKPAHLRVDWQPCMVWNPISFDYTQPPFNDVRVRRALALAIDRKSWIEKLLAGRGRNATMILPWLTYWALAPEKMGEDGKYYTTYDPAEAKKLLQAAGQENLKYEFHTSNVGAYTVTYPYIDLMASMLRQVGITQTTKITDYAVRSNVFHPKGANEGFIVRPDLQSYVWSIVGMSGGLTAGVDNWGALVKNDPEYRAFQDVARKQRLVQDRNERRELIYDMQKRMAKNLWHFYWPAQDAPVVSNKKVHNFRPLPGWNWGGVKYVWKEQA